MSAETRNKRTAALDRTMSAIRTIEKEQGVSPASLEAIRTEVMKLAAQPELFPETEFEAPTGDLKRKRYLLHEDEGGRFAAYLLVVHPGEETKPHDHTTWAVVAGVEGKELNRIYRRTDDGSDPERCTLEVEREFMVQPGTAIAFMPDHIHSIHIQGPQLARHLHVYGLALEKLDARRAYDMETGQVSYYNKAFMTPSYKTGT